MTHVSSPARPTVHAASGRPARCRTPSTGRTDGPTTRTARTRGLGDGGTGTGRVTRLGHRSRRRLADRGARAAAGDAAAGQGRRQPRPLTVGRQPLTGRRSPRTVMAAGRMAPCLDRRPAPLHRRCCRFRRAARGGSAAWAGARIGAGVRDRDRGGGGRFRSEVDQAPGQRGSRGPGLRADRRRGTAGRGDGRDGRGDTGAGTADRRPGFVHQGRGGERAFRWWARAFALATAASVDAGEGDRAVGALADERGPGRGRAAGAQPAGAGGGGGAVRSAAVRGAAAGRAA